jgi:hypothetical protein
MHNIELWNEITLEGVKNQSHKEINILGTWDYNTIIATMEYMGASDNWMKQTLFDLKIAKYRVFDWLAMCIMSRNDDSRTLNNTALKVLVYAFKQANYDERKFVENLQICDYECDRKWDKINIEQV